MASYTPNYNLKKPADADSYDIADANGNMDIIDGALNTLNSKLQKLQGSGSSASAVRCMGVYCPGGGLYIPLVSGRTVNVSLVKAYSPSDYTWHTLTVDSVDSASSGIQRNIHCTMTASTVPGISAGMAVLCEVTATFS